MNISKDVKSDVTIIILEDKLNSITSPAAQKYINQVLDSGVTKVILDLAKLQYISSAGLRVLLSTMKKLETVGGKLGITSLNEVVEEIFEISGFITIFNVYKDQEEALLKF